jgi:hypothetical protein
MSDTDRQPHPSDPDRWADGTLRTGNQAARTHGVRAFETRGESALPADLRVSVDEFRAQIIADQGGFSELTAVQAGYIRRLSELEATARLLAADLTQHGLFTSKRRVRSTYNRWLETLDRWDRIAQRVGAERRARQVDPIEVVRLAVEQANRDAVDSAENGR